MEKTAKKPIKELDRTELKERISEIEKDLEESNEVKFLILKNLKERAKTRLKRLRKEKGYSLNDIKGKEGIVLSSEKGKTGRIKGKK